MILSYLLIVNALYIFQYLGVPRNVVGAGAEWDGEFISNLKKAVWEVILVKVCN